MNVAAVPVKLNHVDHKKKFCCYCRRTALPSKVSLPNNCFWHQSLYSKLKWSEVLPIGAAMPVIIGGQSMQINDGTSHKSLGRGWRPCNAELQCKDEETPPRICANESSIKFNKFSCKQRCTCIF